MNSKSFAFLSLLATLTTTLPAWADYTETTRTLTGDESIPVGGKLDIPTGVTVNLNGHSLTYTDVQSMSTGEGTVSGAGELHISVPSGKSVSNYAKFDGAMQFYKEGEGTFTISQTGGNSPQEFTGGCVIVKGTLLSAKKTLKGSTYPFGKGDITIEADGVLNCNGSYTWSGSPYTIYLKGGKITNTGKRGSGDTSSFCPTIILSADSSFSSSSEYNLGAKLDLGGKTLSVDVGTTTFYWSADIDNGTINVTKGTLILSGDVGKPTANLILGSGTGLSGNAATYSVNDLTVETTADEIGSTIAVYGTYKPSSADGYYPVMMGGSTLDLSGFSEVAVPTAANFDSGTVTIALGNRTLESNQQIVSWTAKPDVAFVFTGTKVDAGKFAISDSGIVYDAKSDVVASATWTGAGAAGNWMDPANWSCKNAAGDEITNPVLTEDLTVTFTGDVSSIAFNNFPFAGVYFNGATLTKGTDWTGFDLNLMTDASVLDLKGQVLTVSAGTGESMTAATITSTVEGGGLTFVVGEGETYTNSSLNLSGNLKLVKDGAGTFVATKPSQEYVGVTEIGGGIVRCGCVNMSGKTPFGASKTIDLVEGGILDPMGSYNWMGHTINMKGGLISNSVAEFGRGTTYNANTRNQFNPTISVLDANACLATTEDFNFQGRIDVGAGTETLVLRIPFGKQFFWNPSATANVHLKVTGGGIFDIWQKNPVTYAKNPNFTLEVEDAALNLHKYNSTDMAGGLDVLDYISAYTNSVNNGTAVLNVAGTFTPASDYFYGCTMLDGSKIDLSSKTEPWSITSLSAGNNTVKFADGATVTLALGERVLTLGEQIVSWTARPVDVTFVFTGDNVDSKVPAVWTDEGLRYGYAEEPQIVWTNGGGDGDLTNPANWEDGVVPTDIKATFTGDVSSINIPAGKAFTAEKIWFREATLSADADFSWLDINKVANDSILDLCGHGLTLSCVDGGCTNAGTVTDSSAEGMGGTVTFVVPEGVTYTNSNFNFTGSLNFVKNGAGVLVAEKYPQLYTGTTTVKAGGVRCAKKMNMNATDKQSPFGVTRTITLEEGSFLDPAGSYAWGNHTIVMAGGIISNTVAQIGPGGGSPTAYNVGNFNYPFNPTLDLRCDSYLCALGLFNFKGEILANGHRLTVNTTGEFRWAAGKSENAVVEFSGKGALVMLKSYAMHQSTCSIVMNGPAFDVGGSMSVSNYTANSSTAISDTHGDKDQCIYVYGTFTPEADDFFGCTMMSNSTINVSEKTDTWSIVRPGKESPTALDYVHFAKNAVVTIDIGTRTPSSRKPVISWTEATRPADDAVTFVLNDAALANHCELEVRENGLYVSRKGLVLLFW